MNKLQQEASNPKHSFWVEASAGTGKTKILTDRVLRLLLTGVPFDQIFCLTFTNAAALEMKERIQDKLKNLASLNEHELKKILEGLHITQPNIEELYNAKHLYQKALNNENKINISTIHSFCQKLLQQFPIEANVTPNFDILNEVIMHKVINDIKNDFYLSKQYLKISDFFLKNFHETTINEIIYKINQHKNTFKKFFYQKNSLFEIPIKVTPILKNQHDLYFRTNLLLSEMGIKLKNFSEIKKFFLTKTLSKRKRIIPSSLNLKYPKLVLKLLELQNEVLILEEKRKSNYIFFYSRMLLHLSKIFIKKYDVYKDELCLLDYDDLILYTQNLLQKPDSAKWISHNTNNCISHLLIDEAQDVSKEQWKIIIQLIDQGNKNNTLSSIFIVGDPKQSIFSFQGAEIDFFYHIKESLKKKFQYINKEFKEITLNVSYRSNESINKIVYLTFEDIKTNNSELFTENNPKIESFRTENNGGVELWPLITNNIINEMFWPTPLELKKTRNPKSLLANKIAQFIKEKIISKEILDSTKLPIKESDFMILLRKRDDLALEIITTLKKNNLEVDDIDKLNLDKNLSVLDIVSIGKFVLAPEDNLNLASLLKSPIFQIKEKKLQSICLTSRMSSIWEYIKIEKLKYQKIYKKLKYFLEIYYSTDAYDFLLSIINSFNIREILLKNNGPNSNDFIDELLYLSRHYFNNINPNLQSFINWFENNKIPIKRNIINSNKIKIMTVHAAKGLQAPIVILCDTTSIPTNKEKFFWNKDIDTLFTTMKENTTEEFKQLKSERQLNELQEYFRLLYVAMTRAEDFLIICGYQLTNNLPENCWYNRLNKTISHYGFKDQNDNILFPKIRSNNTNIEIIIKKQHNNIITKKYSRTISNMVKNTKNNSNLIVKSPLHMTDHLEYGKIFHKILDDCTKINDFTYLLKHPYIKTLNIKLQNKILQSITNLLNNKFFKSLLQYNLQSEVNIGANLKNKIKIARIDLLAIGENEITIVDYKSDFNPPLDYSLIQKSYIEQLMFYYQIIEKVYPKKKINAKILWLENIQFTDILITTNQ